MSFTCAGVRAPMSAVNPGCLAIAQAVASWEGVTSRARATASSASTTRWLSRLLSSEKRGRCAR